MSDLLAVGSVILASSLSIMWGIMTFYMYRKIRKNQSKQKETFIEEGVPIKPKFFKLINYCEKK